MTSAITLTLPPHSGQTDISISKTRLSRAAQVNGAVGESRSTADSVAAGVAVSFRCLRNRLAEPGTTGDSRVQRKAVSVHRERFRLAVFTLQARILQGERSVACAGADGHSVGRLSSAHYQSVE